jgi:hypothetical protein
MTSSARSWPLPVAILAIANIAGTWYKLASDNVPDPYLVRVLTQDDNVIRLLTISRMKCFMYRRQRDIAMVITRGIRRLRLHRDCKFLS